MNKKLKEAIEAVVCATVCDSLDIGDLSWGVKRKLHDGIQSAILDYLNKKVVIAENPATALNNLQGRISSLLKRWELDSKGSKSEWQELHWRIFELIDSIINSDFETGMQLHRGITNKIKPLLEVPYVRWEFAIAIASLALDYIKKDNKEYQAVQESKFTHKVTEVPSFTARDARSAAVKARTYEGFLRNVMDDIEYQTRGGLNVMTITKYSDDYKTEYFPRLMQFLRSIGYEVTQTEVLESKRGTAKTRIKLSIYW